MRSLKRALLPALAIIASLVSTSCEPPLGAVPAVGSGGAGFLLNKDIIDDAKTRSSDPAYAAAYAQIVARAEASLSLGPYAVTDKAKLAPSGDPHDYLSLARYWWPNPDTADGLPYVWRDGQVNLQIHDYDADRQGAMVQASYDLALGYALSGDARYGDRAALLLRVWFLDSATRMNPRLDYAQFIPGVAAGTSSGLIETAEMALKTTEAIRLVDDRLGPSEREGLRQWFSDYLDWLLGSRLGREEGMMAGNHGTYYLCQVIAYALLSGRTELAREAILRAPSLMGAQFRSDGHQPFELSRTRGWDYSVYNLRAWCALAEYARLFGLDLWGYEYSKGRSIGSALSFLSSFLGHEADWPWEQLGGLDSSGLYPLLSLGAARGLADPASIAELPGEAGAYAAREERLLYGY
jgi:hypothetical protein